MNMDVSKKSNDCSIRECFEKLMTGLEAKEKHLKGIQESVAKSSKDIDLRRQSAEELLAQVTKKEEELKQMQLAEEKGLRDWELKKREMGLMLQKLEGEQKRVTEELEKLEKFQKSFVEQWKIKEKILAFRAEALDAKEKELVAREKLLDLVNTEGFAQPHPDNIPNEADSASQKAECSTRNQSKKRRSGDDGDQVKDMNWDSVKDMHTPSPNQQPPMPAKISKEYGMSFTEDMRSRVAAQITEYMRSRAAARQAPRVISRIASSGSGGEMTAMSSPLQSKKRRSGDDGDQGKDMNWDSIKDMHTPSPNQQPPMAASQATSDIPVQRQQ